MRVERGASQILFGLLPGPDRGPRGPHLAGRQRWVDPVQTPLDQDSVRQR